SEKRLLEPKIYTGVKLAPSDWKTAITHAAAQLKHFQGWEIAIIASGRMTNEELFLTSRLAKAMGVQLIDIVPHVGEGDDILLSADRNPNTNGARAILGLTSGPGSQLPQIAQAISRGHVKAIIAIKENPLDAGITPEQLSQLPAFILIDLLENAATNCATALLPSAGYAEKRGSMINGKGRLQRLNRAVRPPGLARADWEILRDLLQEFTGSNGLGSIEDVFRAMAESILPLAGLSFNKIGNLGVK